MSHSDLACYDRFRAKPIDRGATFTEAVSGTCRGMRWRRELADVVAREQRRAKSFDANGVRERLARAGLPTGGEDIRRRLADYMAAVALRKVATKEMVAADRRQQIRVAQADADPVQALTELILRQRQAKVEEREATKVQAAKAAASAARRAGLINTVAPTHAASRPGTVDGLESRSNTTARQPSQRRRGRRQPMPGFDIRAVAARPWTGHERGEQLPLGHKYMKNGGYQDRTRPYIRPSEHQSSRSTSADTQARLTAHCDVLRMSRTKELQRNGYRRVKDFSRPTTPEFWYRQSLDGSRIDISTDGVFTLDGLSGGQGPNRCLVRTREVHVGGRVTTRLDDSMSSTRVPLPGPEEQLVQGPEGFLFAVEGDEAAASAIRNVSRPSTADAPVPKAALRRLDRHECGLDEGSDSWLVGQVSSERHFDFVRALKRGERIS
jgi:hypothetical protein